MRVADALVVLLAAVAIVVARPMWDGAEARPTVRAPAPEDAPTCTGAHDGWRDATGDERAWTSPVRLRSNGALLACPAGSGVMRFDLLGSPALGRHAHAVVIVAGVTAFDGEVAIRERIAVRVAAREPVLIAFVNDLYRSPEEDRDLWVGPVAFTTR